MKRIVIVGAGSAGITVASHLRKKAPDWKIILVDPAKDHFYQPLWTLVGAGEVAFEKTRRPMESVIPKKVKWACDQVVAFSPDENQIFLGSGERLSYDMLVVCPGIQVNWSKIKGLPETLGENGVCSIYSRETVPAVWDIIRSTKKGNALFTFPNTPIKCGGAPQKIMYLAEETFRDNGVRDQIQVEFVSAGKRIFGIPKYRKTLERIVREREIQTSFGLNLVEVDGPKKRAIFENLEDSTLIEKSFEMLHVAPPMSAPDFVADSPLSNEEGWVDVDQWTLQHKRYDNIFSLGDASSLPTSKTGAAIRKECPVLVKNMLAYSKGEKLEARYDGYTSCPVITGRGKLVLAEFDYDGNPVETFPFDQSKERYSMYLLKKYGLPLLYWHGMLKGRA